MKFLKGCLIFAAGGLALLLLIAGGLFFLLTRSPKLEAPVPLIPPNPEAAQRFQTKVDTFRSEIDTAQQAKEVKRISLEITQEELNSFIAQEIERIQQEEGLPMEVKNVQVALQQGQLQALAEVKFQGISSKILVTATATTTEEGRPQLIIKDVDLGSLPLPGPLKDQIDQALAEGLDPSKLDLPLDLEKLQLEAGKIFIEGLTKVEGQPSPSPNP